TDDVKFAFVDAESAYFPVRSLCGVVGVSPSGFYDWRARTLSAHDESDARLLVHIRAFFQASSARYGATKIHQDLLEAGFRTSRKRVARLMREAGLFSRRARRFKATTDSKHALPVAANVLDRKFETTEPNRAWVSDITYVWTREGWLYLAVILDLFSRRVVGFAMSARIDTALVLDALRMAVGRRHVLPGLVLHSDRGSQYASTAYQRALAAHGIVCSMSRKGNCWDNAVAESFFATLKTELVHDARFSSRSEANHEIFDYIEAFYNQRRRHATLAFKSPMQFELDLSIRKHAA
ncbi:MAG: IS3 family transposase, partial [Polyangiaceae bacterium]